MEKFAVDLEKVLDEFEYNEEREENVSAPIRNPPLAALGMGTLRQVTSVRPPAANYRRPSFEPINLADADFAASPPKPSTLGGTSVSGELNEDETFGYVSNKAPVNNKNYVNTGNNLVSALNNGTNVKNRLITESEKVSSQVWPMPHSSMTSDEKPDLLEYNSQNVNFDSNSLENHNQLPDITTSVRAFSHDPDSNENESLPNSLDLISSTSGHLATENGEITKESKSCQSDERKEFIRNGEEFSETIETKYVDNLDETSRAPVHDDNYANISLNVSDTQNISHGYSSLPLNLSSQQIINNVCGKAEINDIGVAHQAQPFTDKKFVSTEENTLKEELENYDNSRFNSQSNVSEQVQPIGFANDSDVSDGELEEYLRELEEMDASGDCKEDHLPEECTEEVEEKISENNQDNGNSLNENSVSFVTSEKSLINYTPANTSTTNESYIVEKKRNELFNQIAHTNVTSSNSHVLEEITSNLQKEKNLSVKCETSVAQSDDFEKYSKSTPQISQNEIRADSGKLKDEVMDTVISGSIVKSEGNLVKMEDTSVSVKGVQNSCDKINTNPFCNTNPFESMGLSKKEIKSNIESTNPFDDEDSGYISEKTESKRKSTNPFEDDDDDDYDISVENRITESPPHSKQEALSESLLLSSEKSQSEHSEKDIVDNVCMKSDVLASMPAVTQSGNKISTDKKEAFSVETVLCSENQISTERKETSSVETVSCSEDQVLTDTKETLTIETDSHSEKQISTDRKETLIVETVFKPKRVDESAINSDSTVEDNYINNSLPSCSNTHQESFSKTLESSAKMIPIKAAVESPSGENVDEAGVPAEEDRPLRPSSLELPTKITVESSVAQSPPLQSPPQSPNAGQLAREFGPEDRRLGRIPPFWVPDTDATSCMQCQQKFTVIKRRHHCRACGQVLCYKCCGLKARLEYMNFAEARVCQPCFTILEALNVSEASSPLGRQPNPNNPMEYCSTIPPLQQVAGSLHQHPPSVMVPVGVLKREGRMKSEVTKQVMFSDGIRPGGDLTELDGSCEPRMPFRRPGRLTKRVGTPPGGVMSPSMRRVLDSTTHSFIPFDGDGSLPPIVSKVQGEITFSDLETPIALNQPNLKFALNRNLFVFVKRVMLDCCVNKECWCFSTEGLACVGQDEIVFLLECLPQETQPPKDIFILINNLYQEAAKGSTVSEMSFTPATSNNLLGSKDHGGFLYIRTSYQCTAQLVLPSPPYLVALLIHRWETPWARLFPLRLVLRLGAEFRYYPCPLVSVRNRPSLYTDIGHTIINILADFRKYSYTLPSVRGLVIHMEDRQTTINIPRNRYDQVVRALNNSNDSVLAFGANLSLAADSHLVCMQSAEDENTSYTTQAINIHNKPRKVTGASFVVFNGALKVPGLAGKSNIVEDGLMVQVPSETMTALRTALRDMRDYTIGCGPNAEETVALQWTADDTNFNIGVKSCIDGRPLDGVPSIRVHNGTDYSGGTRIIRWTEVFILQCEDSDHSNEPLDISRLSESIARATCLALVPLLDLLSAASFSTLAVRTTIHPDNVGYEAGSNGEKLPPLYMKSLDEELIAVVHQAALASQDNPCVLELVFRIMEQG